MMFAADGDRIVVDLAPGDRRLIGRLPEILAEATDDPSGDVLDRPAHVDDADVSERYRRAMGPVTALQRAEDRAVAFAVADGRSTLTADEGRSLLRCINEARLVLASGAGAFEEGSAWEERITWDPALALVGWLGYVQSRLLQAMEPAG